MLPHLEVRVILKATNTAPALHNTSKVAPAGLGAAAAQQGTPQSAPPTTAAHNRSRIGPEQGRRGLWKRTPRIGFRAEGGRGLWRGPSHSRRLSRAVGGVSLSPEGSRRLGAQHAGAGARWARPRELLTASWDREPVAARGAGEHGRRCWQLRRAFPARPGRAGSEMPGAQASVGRHQTAVGSGQKAPERTGAGRPPAAANPPVPWRSVRDAIRSSRASDLSESRGRC